MEKQKLPNSTAVIVLGILSVLTCCCVGGAIGIILGIVAIILAKKDIFVQRESKVMTATLISTSGGLWLSWDCPFLDLPVGDDLPLCHYRPGRHQRHGQKPDGKSQVQQELNQ
jgi:hypothetical protein